MDNHSTASKAKLTIVNTAKRIINKSIDSLDGIRIICSEAIHLADPSSVMLELELLRAFESEFDEFPSMSRKDDWDQSVFEQKREKYLDSFSKAEAEILMACRKLIEKLGNG